MGSKGEKNEHSALLFEIFTYFMMAAENEEREEKKKTSYAFGRIKVLALQ